MFPVSLQKIRERINIQYLEGTKNIVLIIKVFKTKKSYLKNRDEESNKGLC